MESLAQEIDFEKREEAFLAQLFDCVLLEARITMRQCELNQRKAHSEFPGRNYLCLKCTQEKTPIETVLTPPAAVEKLVPAGRDWMNLVTADRKKRRKTAVVHETGAIVQETVSESPSTASAVHEETALATSVIASKNETKQEELCKPAPTAPVVKENNVSKKVTCPTCKRPNLTLATVDKCGRCYDRVSKGKDPVTGEPVTKEESPALPPPAALVPEKPAESEELHLPALKTVAELEQDLVPLPFDGDDQEMLRMLQESAHYHRRTLQQEILFRLDRSLDLRRAAQALRMEN